jgi:hypothetical protein
LNETKDWASIIWDQEMVLLFFSVQEIETILLPLEPFKYLTIESLIFIIFIKQVDHSLNIIILLDLDRGIETCRAENTKQSNLLLVSFSLEENHERSILQNLISYFIPTVFLGFSLEIGNFLPLIGVEIISNYSLLSDILKVGEEFFLVRGNLVQQTVLERFLKLLFELVSLVLEGIPLDLKVSWFLHPWLSE